MFFASIIDRISTAQYMYMCLHSTVLDIVKANEPFLIQIEFNWSQLRLQGSFVRRRIANKNICNSSSKRNRNDLFGQFSLLFAFCSAAAATTAVIIAKRSTKIELTTDRTHLFKPENYLDWTASAQIIFGFSATWNCAQK